MNERTDKRVAQHLHPILDSSEPLCNIRHTSIPFSLSLQELSTEDEDEMPGVTIATAAGVKELRSCRGLEWDDSTI